MDPELQAQVNMPVVLMNREGLYAIVAVLGVSILGCACVLTYSFTNYSKMKRNAEEVRSYMESRAKLVQQHSGAKQAGGGFKVADAPSATDKASIPALPRNVEMEKQQWSLDDGNETSVSQTAMSAVATMLDASTVARNDVQLPNVDEGGVRGDETGTVASDVGKDAQLVYSTVVANVSGNGTEPGFVEAA
ncbi:hypothetical protein HPB50_021547 [Hyalomma asiaticum]|uniref:Uncharacterized protein n=1 Tax=Hyalomma asiaticum TaxID=266040 RepID=A0ACB7TL78_HYAAI|nr:hypothetical protein HPB50_021547 [Hyalomma asiaticum]